MIKMHLRGALHRFPLHGLVKEHRPVLEAAGCQVIRWCSSSRRACLLKDPNTPTTLSYS